MKAGGGGGISGHCVSGGGSHCTLQWTEHTKAKTYYAGMYLSSPPDDTCPSLRHWWRCCPELRWTG